MEWLLLVIAVFFLACFIFLIVCAVKKAKKLWKRLLLAFSGLICLGISLISFFAYMVAQAFKAFM